MKVDQIIEKMYGKLFSISTQTCFAEQLARGKGHFRIFFEKIPITSHGLGQSISNEESQCRLRFKYFLASDEILPRLITDHFNIALLCDASLKSNAKITGKVFYYKRLKISERNIKKFSVKSSLLLRGKAKYSLDDNESGTPCEDYFVTARDQVLEDITSRDNFKGCGHFSGKFAAYLYSYFSPFPNQRFSCLSIKALHSDDKNAGRENARKKSVREKVMKGRMIHLVPEE